jgi:hypothetical protein
MTSLLLLVDLENVQKIDLGQVPATPPHIPFPSSSNAGRWVALHHWRVSKGNWSAKRSRWPMSLKRG